jgi:hypothetical protein
VVRKPSEASWSETAIEEACLRSQEWFSSLPEFPSRVNLKTVVGRKSPAILSERDCVINFARFLHEAGVPWDAIHHEVPVARWIFDAPHPAATAIAGGKQRQIDLVVVKTEDLLQAELPALAPGFQFDAFLEFGLLSDYWTQPNARIYNNDPEGSRNKVAADVEKIGRHLSAGACRVGYVIVFEECDHEFETAFAVDAERKFGCRVRFIRAGRRPRPR